MAALIESDLWGLQLTPKKTYSQTVEMPFRITMAALGPSIQASTRSSVFVRVEETDFVLCSLTPEKCEQQILNHVFVPGEEITLYTDGENTISLTGNFLVYHDDELAEGGSFPVDSDYSDYSDDEEDEEDEEIDSDDIDFIDDSDEEDASDEELDGEPKIIEIKNPKDIKTLAKGPQKGKSAKVADSEEEEEEDDDSEEDDDEEIDSEDEEDDEFDSEEEDDDEDEEEDSDEDDEDDDEEDEEEDSEEDEEDSDEESEEDDMETSLKGQSGNKRVVSAAANAGAKKPAVATSGDAKAQPKTTPANVPASKNQPTEAKKENVQPTANRQQEAPAAKNASTEKKPAQAQEEKTEKKVVSLGSGLTYEDVQVGKGPVVTKGQKVNILYKGTLSNGKVFDENFSSKQALPFVVGKKEVVEGLDRAIQGVHVGGVRKITIPPQLAYGNKKLDGIPPNSTLTFEVKVLSVAGKQQPFSK